MAAIDNINPEFLSDEANVTSAVKTIATNIRNAEKVHGKIMVAAAYTTYMAVEVYQTHTATALAKAWAKPITQPDGTVEYKPQSGSYMTNLKRLGKVSVKLDVQPGTTVWTMLAGKSGAQVGEVGTVIAGENVKFSGPDDKKGTKEPLTLDLLEEVLAVAFPPEKGSDAKFGKTKISSAEITKAWDIRNGKTVADKDSDDDSEGAKDGDGNPITLEGTRTANALVKVGIANLLTNLDTLSPSEFTAVEPDLKKVMDLIVKSAKARTKAVEAEQAEKKSA